MCIEIYLQVHVRQFLKEYSVPYTCMHVYLEKGWDSLKIKMDTFAFFVVFFFGILFNTLSGSRELCCLIHFHLLTVCVLKGRVVIAAQPGVKLQIPDGVVLKNEVHLEIVVALLERFWFFPVLTLICYVFCILFSSGNQ